MIFPFYIYRQDDDDLRKYVFWKLVYGHSKDEVVAHLKSQGTTDEEMKKLHAVILVQSQLSGLGKPTLTAAAPATLYSAVRWEKAYQNRSP